MKTQHKTILPSVLSLAAIVLLVWSVISPEDLGLKLVTASIMTALAAGIFATQRKKSEKEIVKTKQTVKDHISSFLFNNGKSESEDALGELGAELKKSISLIKCIGDGKFDIDYPGMTDDLKELNQNNLSGELLHMKMKMQQVAEEDRQRNWATNGIAKFSEIVRQQDKTVETISNEFISELVKYIGANQGGIFIVNDQQPGNILIELKGCYAYGRRKFVENVIKPGEGLVGQAYLEGDLIFLKDVPKNYVTITSGLGQATPRCVVLVPLKHHSKVEGILEIACFEIWKKFELDFLLKIGDILGSAISAMRINEMTKKLLNDRIKAEHEQLQYIEELRAQEEELKQNMEELQATQDEIHRQMQETAKLNRELDARVVALNTTTIMSESDIYGGIVYINEKFCEVSQYSREELVGKPHSIVRHPDMPKEVFRLMWQTIKAGKVFRGIVKNRKKDGTHYWVDAVISPVLDDDGKPLKYIGVRYVIEDEQQAQKLFDQQLRKLGLLRVDNIVSSTAA
ncbi:MAG TPA: PAS domain-containing protein [Cyclobacteriaceae bacterium]|jgi:PAS domain S-box-containing protein|nr:PAS domain-containing protein [Cyclobacteriaceae bacterium]